MSCVKHKLKTIISRKWSSVRVVKQRLDQTASLCLVIDLSAHWYDHHILLSHCCVSNIFSWFSVVFCRTFLSCIYIQLWTPPWLTAGRRAGGRAPAPDPALPLAAAAERKCALRERGKKERETGGRGGRASNTPKQFRDSAERRRRRRRRRRIRIREEEEE